MSIWRGKSFRAEVFDSNYEITDFPLWVNACGEDHILMAEDYRIDRPHGRNDYQMLYLKEGYGYFLIQGNIQKVVAPSVVIYKPHEYQHYLYEKNKKTDIFWIHFSGNMVEHYLDKYRINQPFMKLHHAFGLYETCVNRMLVELQTEFSSDLCGALLHTLLIDLSRMYSQTQYQPVRSAGTIDTLSKIHELMQSNFAEHHSIKYYAELCNVTEIHFIKIFRTKFHITPRQYIIQLRVNKAAQLLMETTLSVKTIAMSVGFDNPLYFSKLFKSMTAMTPSEFRQKNT